MTDDDFKGLILFKLMDYDLSNVVSIAVDCDSEIVVSYDDILEQRFYGGQCIWRTNCGSAKLTKIYMNLTDITPENHKTVLIIL